MRHPRVSGTTKPMTYVVGRMSALFLPELNCLGLVESQVSQGVGKCFEKEGPVLSGLQKVCLMKKDPERDLTTVVGKRSECGLFRR